MLAIFAYLVALALSHVIGALWGNAIGQIISFFTKAERVNRFGRGISLGTGTTIASVQILNWLGKPIYLAFLVVLISTFFALTIYNYSSVKTAMKTHRSNADVYMKLNNLQRMRLMQDLSATISALITTVILIAIATSTK